MRFFAIFSFLLLHTLPTSAKPRVIHEAADFVYTWDKQTHLLAARDSGATTPLATLLIDDIPYANRELRPKAVSVIHFNAELTEAAKPSKCYDTDQAWYLTVELGTAYSHYLYFIRFDKATRTFDRQKIQFPLLKERVDIQDPITSTGSFICAPYLFQGFSCYSHFLLTIRALDDPERILQSHRVLRDSAIGIKQGTLYKKVNALLATAQPRPLKFKNEAKLTRRFLNRSSNMDLFIWANEVAPSVFHLKIGAYVYYKNTSGPIMNADGSFAPPMGGVDSERIFFFNAFLESPELEALPEEAALEFMK
ncbi:MAG: hypothetical protein AAFR05_22520 [Bacteroidota bacterium]